MQDLKQFWAQSIQEANSPIEKLISAINGIARYKRTKEYHIQDQITEYKQLTNFEEPTALDFYKADPGFIDILKDKLGELRAELKLYEMYVGKFKNWLKYNPNKYRKGTEPFLWAVYKFEVSKSGEFDLDVDWTEKKRAIKQLEFEILSLEISTGKMPKDKTIADFRWKVLNAKQTPLIGMAQNLGVELKRINGKWCCNCIFHQEDTPSLFFYEDSNKYKCYGCGEHGDVINLVMKVHNIDFKEAVNYLNSTV